MAIAAGAECAKVRVCKKVGENGKKKCSTAKLDQVDSWWPQDDGCRPRMDCWDQIPIHQPGHRVRDPVIFDDVDGPRQNGYGLPYKPFIKVKDLWDVVQPRSSYDGCRPRLGRLC